MGHWAGHRKMFRKIPRTGRPTCDQDVTAVVQFDDNVIGSVANAELNVDDTIETELSDLFDSLVFQVLSQLHREAVRRRLLRPVEFGQVKSAAALDQQHVLVRLFVLLLHVTGRLTQLDQVGFVVHVVHVHHAQALASFVQLGQQSDDVQGGES